MSKPQSSSFRSWGSSPSFSPLENFGVLNLHPVFHPLSPKCRGDSGFSWGRPGASQQLYTKSSLWPPRSWDTWDSLDSRFPAQPVGEESLRGSVTLSVGFSEERERSREHPLNTAVSPLHLPHEDPAAHPIPLGVHRGAQMTCVYRQKSWVLGFWCHGPLDAGGSGCLQHPPPPSTHIHPERESCLCVPRVGDRPGSHDINAPLGLSPAESKVLESVLDPDPHPHTLGTQASSP